MWLILAVSILTTALNFYDALGRTLVISLFLITILGLVLSRRFTVSISERFGKLWGLAMLAQLAVTGYLETPVGPYKKILLIALLILSVSTLFLKIRGQLTAVIVGFYLCASTYLTIPPPQFDLWYLQETAISLFGLGKSPYALSYYAGIPLVDSWVKSNPYPPAHLILITLGNFFGDFRWGLFAGVMISTLSLWSMARRAPTLWPMVIPILFLFHHKTFITVWRSWTEPTLVGAIALSVWALLNGHRRLLITTLGVVMAMKQFGFLFVLVLFMNRHLSFKDLIKTACITGAIFFPFLLWDPMGLLSGVLLTHLHTPPRPDSMSFPALIRLWGGPQLSGLTPFIAGGAWLIWIRKRSQSTLTIALIESALLFLIFFLASPKAHENYYFTPFFLTLAALCSAQLPKASPRETV